MENKTEGGNRNVVNGMEENAEVKDIECFYADAMFTEDNSHVTATYRERS